MDELRKEQIEALETVVPYIEKLVPAFTSIAQELKTEKQDDTIEFMNQAIEGLNFVIEIFNATDALLNQEKEVFQKDVIESKVQAMNEAVASKDDAKTAFAIEDGIIPFLEIFEQIAKVYLAGN